MYGLHNDDIKRICAVFAAHKEVRQAILYGSRAKGNECPNSDIDLTLLGDHLNLSLLFHIDNELDDLLLPYTIDLSVYHQIDNPSLLAHITRVGKVFYEQEQQNSATTPSSTLKSFSTDKR